MAQLSADKTRKYESRVNPVFNDLPVKAAVTIYEGSMVGGHGGDVKRARQLVAGDPFFGFAERKADNAAGAADAINVHIRSRGAVELTFAETLTGANLGDTVYASDGDTVTLTSTGNSVVGKIHRIVSSSKAIVFFESAAIRSV